MKTMCLAVMLVSVSAASWAADGVPLAVKTGEWEVTTISQQSGQMPFPADMLSKLSPEQRARLEADVKANAARGPHKSVTKSCVTKEDLNTPFWGHKSEDASCKWTIVSSSPQKTEAREECSGKGLKRSNTIQLEALNSETVKGVMHSTASAGQRTMNGDATLSGRWLGATCSKSDE